jgi:sugar lactone lactonase YvrE
MEMRKFPLVCIACLLLMAACNKKQETADEQTTATPPETAASMTIADPAFQTPECVLHDRAGDVYLVSNINGGPGEKDNNGFISRVSPDGAATVGKWIEAGVNGVALDAPKGMTIQGDTLYVADIDNVRLFDRNTGAPLESWPIAGASFLNDMASGPDGAVYVSDSGFKATPEGFSETGSDAVYRLGANGAATAVAKDPSLGRPNGLFVDGNSIIVVTFGTGQVYRLDAATGAKTDMPTPPAGQLDGVVRLADGSLLVSSWAGSAVYRLIGEDAYGTAVDSVTSPADIGYDTQRGRVLIPSFMENKILVREVR